VPSRRVSVTGNSRGINFVFVRVVSHPANGVFTIMDLRGEFVLRRVSIVDGNNHIAASCHSPGISNHVKFRSTRPRTSMDCEYRWIRTLPVWNINVASQLVFVALTLATFIDNSTIFFKLESLERGRSCLRIGEVVASHLRSWLPRRAVLSAHKLRCGDERCDRNQD